MKPIQRQPQSYYFSLGQESTGAYWCKSQSTSNFSGSALSWADDESDQTFAILSFLFKWIVFSIFISSQKECNVTLTHIKSQCYPSLLAVQTWVSFSLIPSIPHSLYLFSTCDRTVLSSVMCCLTFRLEPAVRRCFVGEEDTGMDIH